MNVLCIGSAVMDITGHPIPDSSLWQEKQRISGIQISPGGDAVNQSIYLAQLGSGPALAACVGNDTNGMVLKNILKEKQVDISMIRETSESATGTALVLVSPEGERNTFSVKGAHSLLSKENVPWELPEECRAISLASLFSMPLWEADGMLDYLKKMKSEGRLIFADLGSDKLGQGLAGIEPFLPYIDYFLPSLYDVLAMTGTQTAEEAARIFREKGTAHVIIKCGAKGCFCSSAEFEGWIPALKVEVVDTTGAGDCMSAVFLHRILQGDSVKAACRYACAAASYSTLFMGASAAALSDEIIRKLLADRSRQSVLFDDPEHAFQYFRGDYPDSNA